MTTIPRRALLLTAGLVLLAGAACSSDKDDGLRADTQSIDSSKPQEDGETATGDESDTNESGSSLGSATAQLPADPNDQTLVPLRLDVMALERNDDLVELRVTLTNEGETDGATFEPWRAFVDERNGPTWDLSGVGLVDGGAKKLYLPVLDSEGTCLCSGDMSNVAIPPGESVELNATFGGVPDDVDQLDVRFPSFSSIDGVPVR